MITITGPTVSGGGTPGSNLWQLIGGGPDPDSIELASPATGIEADMPGNTMFKQILALAPLFDPANSYAGNVWWDGADIIFFAGMTDQPGVPAPCMLAINLATGTTSFVTTGFDSFDNANIVFHAKDSSGNKVVVTYNSTGVTYLYNSVPIFQFNTNGTFQIINLGSSGTQNLYVDNSGLVKGLIFESNTLFAQTTSEPLLSFESATVDAMYSAGGFINTIGFGLGASALFQVDFTDENNVPQTVTIIPLGGTIVVSGYYALSEVIFRVKANTVITVFIQVGGSIEYDAGAIVKQVSPN